MPMRQSAGLLLHGDALLCYDLDAYRENMTVFRVPPETRCRECALHPAPPLLERGGCTQGLRRSVVTKGAEDAESRGPALQLLCTVLDGAAAARSDAKQRMQPRPC